MTSIDFNFFCSAARTGDIAALEHCLNCGIDIHLCNDLALRYAEENGQTEAVIFLRQHGANIHVLDDISIRKASLEGDIQTVEKLLKKGFCSEEAKLYAMYNAMLCGYDEIVKLLFKNDISPDNEAVLRVLKICKHDKVIALFEDYLK